MLDRWIFPRIAPYFQKLGQNCVQAAILPNHITWIGFALGLGGIFSVAMGSFGIGFVFFLLNRFLDGVDGATARAAQNQERSDTQSRGVTKFGAYLDAALDYVVCAGFIFAFSLAAPHNALAASFAIFTYSASQAAYAALRLNAAQNAVQEQTLPTEPFRLIGESEILIFVTLCCLWPSLFPGFSAIFGIACIASFVTQTFAAARRF